ncbi:thiamine phosphate synthase [Jannaschia sp. Os4]|uniref:thiamine phosphate synthase n=1 Tax=Jannaschia sp. Os4 TaxID=2807617 RepID=UPI0019398736|nr:thiamine phosphate synthase [Jannaschia sp. Os4]MBM2576603.1 thiamine phosphate synthase [Jannaschia sp. Os4]
MDDTNDDGPQIYLVTPPEADSTLPDRVAAVLDATAIACVRLSLSTRDEGRIVQAADGLREVCHARDVPLVIADHPGLVTRLGLDGVHLTDPRGIRALRKDWGDDPIVGAWAGTSRHDGMNAGEAGADYVSFGPLRGVGDEPAADADLFAWWSEMIELPVVAEGGLDVAAVEALAPVADFLAVGEEVWGDDPVGALRALLAPIL